MKYEMENHLLDDAEAFETHKGSTNGVFLVHFFICFSAYHDKDHLTYFYECLCCVFGKA
jgi:hypothetical protein